MYNKTNLAAALRNNENSSPIDELKNITTCTYKPGGHRQKWNLCGTVWWPTQPIAANSKNKIWHKENIIQKELITKTALQRKTFHTIIIIIIIIIIIHFQNILL
jgi:hypothetical protein